MSMFLRISPSDLRITGTDEQRHRRTMTRRVAIAAAFALLGALATASQLPGISPLILVLIAAGPPAWVMHRSIDVIRRDAMVRRRDMDLAVAVFLDLVNVLLAGGAGVETAMLAAAGAGDGWAFEQIRFAIVRAQSARTSYWEALLEFGRDTGVESLEEVAHSVQLAGEYGARIRQSLASKANALRTRNLARIEHDAQQQTERMGLPIVALFVGFILLVGYPAFAGTMGSL